MKRYQLVILIVALALTLATGVFALGFWAIQARRSVPLMNGYRLYCDFDDGPVISVTARGVADKARLLRLADEPCYGSVALVDGYRVYPKVIVGHVHEPVYDNPYDKPRYRPGDGTMPRKPGYFIIDPNTDRIYNGLKKQEWRKKLRSFGVTSEPELFKPSPLDGYLGRNKPK